MHTEFLTFNYGVSESACLFHTKNKMLLTSKDAFRYSGIAVIDWKRSMLLLLALVGSRSWTSWNGGFAVPVAGTGEALAGAIAVAKEICLR